MKNVKLSAAVIGLILNFALFLVKLYIGISSNCLTIYCDAINNLGDTFACVIAILGFSLVKRLGEREAGRLQSLCSFVIEMLIAATGLYFVYNGLERVMYPLPVQYATKHLVILLVVLPVKIIMGFMYKHFNRGKDSSVLKALELDSFLDFFITLSAVMSFVLIRRVNFSADGFFAIITGGIISVSAIKNIISEAKYLIND